MQAHLTLNLIFAWLLLVPTARRAFSAGIVGSFALILHNPVPHTLFAIPWLLSFLISDERRKYLLPLLLGYLPIAAGLGIGWLALRVGIAGKDTPGQIMAITMNAVVSLPDKTMISMRTAGLVKMWLWSAPGVYLLAIVARRRYGDDWRICALANSAVLTFCGYLIVSLDQGHGWGNRYFQSSFGVIPILAATAMKEARLDRKTICFFGAAAILTLLTLIPFQLNQIRAFIAHHLALIPTPQEPGNNVYFIHPYGAFYVADMAQIDPALRTRDLFLSTRGREIDREMVRQNWPNAVQLHGYPWVDHWYLGPDDQRIFTPGEKDSSHFNITFDTQRVTPPHPDQ
jgi:hypothetical protein